MSSDVDKEFEWVEIEPAVRSMCSGKALGINGVTAEMIKRVWMAISVRMKMFYNECLRRDMFPSHWKKARMVVLLKSPENVRSYQPMSVLPICLNPESFCNGRWLRGCKYVLGVGINS